MIASLHPVVEESEFVRGDGERRKVRTTRTLIDGPDRPGQYILGLSEDVTRTRHAEAEVLRLAHHDTLTGLKNRAAFSRKLHDLVEAQTAFALLCIDLDRFKTINDRTGHPAGDDVLTEIGRRLQLLVAADDLIARTGGDEFCIILTGTQLRERARDVAATVLRRIREPCETRHSATRCSASIGIVLFPQDAKTSLDLRQFGDLALYRAKESGGDNACFFEPRMAVAARSRRALEADLRSAIENDEISVRYQPILSVRTGRIASAEALARWTHPRHGPISPDIFIPMAEEAGLIDVLSNHMLRRACTDALAWPADTQVAVNLSALQFQTGELIASVEDLLSETGLPAKRLQLEVTEQLLIRDLDRSFAELERLRDLGIQILMDDFGTGYSSLHYFQRFRFDKVKIDKSFVQSVTTSRTARAIVQAVVGLGEQLQIGVVAEGVETESQMTALTALGCTHLQGFLFSKPLSAAQARATMTTGTCLVDQQIERAA